MLFGIRNAQEFPDQKEEYCLTLDWHAERFMKSGDAVRVKLLANVERRFRGCKGTVSADSEPDGLVLVKMEDEPVTHQFLAKDLEKIKKPYEPPAFRFEAVFVTSALSCGKVGHTEVDCHTNRKVS